MVPDRPPAQKREVVAISVAGGDTTAAGSYNASRSSTAGFGGSPVAVERILEAPV